MGDEQRDEMLYTWFEPIENNNVRVNQIPRIVRGVFGMKECLAIDFDRIHPGDCRRRYQNRDLHGFVHSEYCDLRRVWRFHLH